MKRRRAASAVVAMLSLLGAVAVAEAGPATATVDQYQELVVTTEPAGAVTIGQSFSLDASWSNRSGFAIPGFRLSVDVPSGFRVDEALVVESTPTARTCSTSGDPSSGTVVVCDFGVFNAPPDAHLAIRLSITALVEAYDARLVATASNNLGLDISDSAVVDVVRGGVTADVHPFALTAPTGLFVGQPVTVTSSVANGGTTTMNGVTATFDVGSGLRVDSATWGTARTPCQVVGTTRASCAIGTMGARSAVPVAFSLTPTTATSSVTARLTVTATTPEQQPDPVPNTVTITRSVQPNVADLGISLHMPDEAFVDALLSGEVVVHNHGPAPARQVDVVYTVPVGVEVFPGPFCSAAGVSVTCRLMALQPNGTSADAVIEPGASASVKIDLRPSSTAPGTVVARVSSTTPEPSPDPTANATSAALPAVGPAAADLRLDGWTAPTTVVVGTPTTTTLTFTNTGPSRTRGLRATITFPSTWTITTVSSPGCTWSGATATCQFDPIVPGANSLGTRHVVITATPSAVGRGQVASATVTGEYPDAGGPLIATAVVDVVDQPTVTIGPPITIAEGGEGYYPATLDAPSLTPVSMTCLAGGWTAGPSDFSFGSPTTVTFEPGQTQASFWIAATPDALDEPDAEVVLVACGGVVNAHAANPVWGLMWGVVGIIDDDPPPVILPGGISQLEGAAPTVDVPVTLSAPSDRTVTARWQTEDHVARAPDDYTSASGTVTFQPGETAKTIAVTVRNDTTEEPDELFVVVFSGPQNATIGGFYGLAFVNLLDDD